MVLNQNLDDSRQAGHFFFVKNLRIIIQPKIVFVSVEEDMDVHSARCDCKKRAIERLFDSK